jgi:pre-mRNA-splicing factor ATP-dependent RNA helicase DHX15/PRP43
VIDKKPQWVLFQDFVLTSRNYVRTVTTTSIEWLIELSPHYYDLENWPEGETKIELEGAYRRLMQQRQYAETKKTKGK